MTEEIRLSSHQDVEQLFGWGIDENWKFVDKNGHHHYYRNGYPTLELREGGEWCECCDGYAETWYECRECGERITPGRKQKVFYVPGRTSYYMNDMPISKEEFDEQIAKVGGND